MNLSLSYGKITLNKIYDEQEMLLINRRSKFTEYIEDLLILYLSDNKNSMPITLTYREMAEYFCMINKDYSKAKQNRYRYVDDFTIKTNIMHYSEEDCFSDKCRDMGIFFGITDKLIKDIINDALKSLKQKSLILYRDNFKIYKKVWDNDFQKDVVLKYICTKEQRAKFIDIRQSVMAKNEIKKLQDVIYLSKEKREKYFDELSNALKQCDELYNCTHYANAYDIEYGEKGIEHECRRIKSRNQMLIKNNMQYKLLTTKELECIHSTLKTQFIDRFI